MDFIITIINIYNFEKSFFQKNQILLNEIVF